MNSREVKIEAKEILGDNKNKLIFITMLGLLIPQIPSLILNFTSIPTKMPLVTLIIAVVVLVFQRAFTFALTKTYIARKNGEPFGNFDFISDGIQNLKRAWSISLHLIPKFIFPILCYVVAIVSGIISVVSNVSTSLSLGKTFNNVSEIITIVLYVVALVSMIKTTYKYRYADIEAINNPDLTSREIIEKTGEIMEGNRLRSFYLDASLLLWAFAVGFLGGLAGGLVPIVGTIIVYWFIALIQVNLMMSHIVLYDDISGSSADVIPSYMPDRNTDSDIQPDPFNY